MSVYRSYIKKDTERIRKVLVLLWLLVAATGVASMYTPPLSLLREVGNVIPTISGILTFVGGLLAAYGATSDTRNAWEWVFSSVAAAGLAAYTSTQIVFVASGSFNFWMNALLGAIAVGFTMYRSTSCAAHARQVRELHEVVKERDND